MWCLIDRGAVKERWASSERLEQACGVNEEAAILLTQVLELMAQMPELKFRLVDGPFMS